MLVYHSVLEKNGGEVTSFWRDEYALDHLISRHAKPVVALMEGIVLGGGMGVAAHASHRVVSDTSRLGFPETAIGFVPDGDRDRDVTAVLWCCLR